MDRVHDERKTKLNKKRLWDGNFGRVYEKQNKIERAHCGASA